MSRRYHVVTLGCKLNQFDTAEAEGLLRARAWRPTEDPREAELVLLNTCTVTSRADAEARRLARRLRRLAPKARIVATGCYAERDAKGLAESTPIDEVVPLSERERLATALLGVEECVTAPPAMAFGDSGRAWLRVQEGCDLSCAYCIIPTVRGPGRSVPAPRVVAEVRSFARRGAREIGLTGVNTGSWGRDLEPKRRFSDLLEELLEADAGVRIRLNSLEPRTVTRRVLELMRDHPRVFLPHVQIPLQAGSERVLARMSRNYRTGFYRDKIHEVVETVPDVCVGADVITGFPGESEEEHAETLSFLESLPLAYLHVFSYSDRPGTRAAKAEDKVAPQDIKERTTRLRALGAEKARAFRERMLGRVFEGLALHAFGPEGATRVLTGNYIEVLVPGAKPGEVVAVALRTLDPTSAPPAVRGELVAPREADEEAASA